MHVSSFEDLIVWQKAHKLTIRIYECTREYPKEELFGLVGQIRRSAASVCANIAEGHRKNTRDFARFLQIAQASLQETKYHLILSRDLGYIHSSNYEEMYVSAEEVGRMIHGLRQRLIT